MEAERKAILCYNLGFIQGHLGLSGKDARIKLDQVLIDLMNQPPVTKEEKQYLSQLGDEIDFTMMQMGINRKTAREIARSKK